MKKTIGVIVIVFVVIAGGVLAQTPKYKYEITKFGAPLPGLDCRSCGMAQ